MGLFSKPSLQLDLTTFVVELVRSILINISLCWLRRRRTGACVLSHFINVAVARIWLAPVLPDVLGSCEAAKMHHRFNQGYFLLIFLQIIFFCSLTFDCWRFRLTTEKQSCLVIASRYSRFFILFILIAVYSDHMQMAPITCHIRTYFVICFYSIWTYNDLIRECDGKKIEKWILKYIDTIFEQKKF